MGRRYERAGADGGAPAGGAERTDEDRAQDAWKALDRGEDPTEPASPRPAPSGTGPVRCDGPPAGAGPGAL